MLSQPALFLQQSRPWDKAPTTKTMPRLRPTPPQNRIVNRTPMTSAKTFTPDSARTVGWC
jgi:hypothetical protein